MDDRQLRLKNLKKTSKRDLAAMLFIVEEGRDASRRELVEGIPVRIELMDSFESVVDELKKFVDNSQ
jgi:hypothetical protein